MKQPHAYKKRILLAVSGMSPQIVTETLYALAVNQTDAFIPTEIHLISTNAGKNEAVLKLLHPKTGQFYQLCNDYGLTGIEFSEKNIHVIANKQGVLLDDIKTPEENEAAADFITQKVNELTRDDDSALHVSIAGGRKTMGYYLGYALSLYGRAQDRLSHVLVTDRYESLRDFFYPTPYSHVVHDRDNKALDAQAAEVILASIPFVRLRTGLPKCFLENNVSFNDSVRFARSLEADPVLEIDLEKRRLFANGIEVKLKPIDFPFYLWMIQETVFKNDRIKRGADSNLDYADSFLSLYETLCAKVKDIEKTQEAMKKGMDDSWLSDRNTAVNKAFKKALGDYGARSFLVVSDGKNNNRTYHLTLTQAQIIGFNPKI